ncbi:hypothetical protein [Meridianimarinicoccus roseus]|jgi:long-subunit acyl-CoA synthetase (AMP-forming)|nr:hypothetical protein [Meridianimarinicoccus roseus]
MKTMLLAFVAAGLIAVLADYGLTEFAGFSAQEQTTGSNVRLD